MDFKYIKKLKPFIILAMILIFMPIVTKAGGIIPSDFNGFAVTSDEIIVIGDNTAITGWKNNKKVFSFSLPLETDYALSVNQDNNIVIFTKNARLVFAQDGTPLTLSENTSVDIEKLKSRQVITTADGTSYVLTNRFAIENTITKVKNGEKTTVYTTPLSVIFAEFAFWEGNLILIIASIAALLDVRKRRFVNPKVNAPENNGITETAEPNPKKEIELPKFLKAFQKPETYNKGAAFSSEFSTKPGERPRFLETIEETKDEIPENDANETTESL